ncbi:MAG: hypothetical protein ACK5F7_09060, partial [Planctomycetaceae bacterium]
MTIESKTGTDSAMTHWRSVRESIEHENHLINHRMTWLLSAQFFLVAAFAAVYKDGVITPDDPKLQARIFLTVIACIAIVISIQAGVAITAADRQIRFLVAWFSYHYLDGYTPVSNLEYLIESRSFPPISGHMESRLFDWMGVQSLAQTIVAGWAFLLVITYHDLLKKEALQYGTVVSWLAIPGIWLLM